MELIALLDGGAHIGREVFTAIAAHAPQRDRGRGRRSSKDRSVFPHQSETTRHAHAHAAFARRAGELHGDFHGLEHGLDGERRGVASPWAGDQQREFVAAETRDCACRSCSAPSRRAPTSFNSVSPASWLKMSLISLKRSRSIRPTANWLPFACESAIRLASCSLKFSRFGEARQCAELGVAARAAPPCVCDAISPRSASA